VKKKLSADFHRRVLLKNEKTNSLVENPIAKVLRSGKIVGLANHTVLINKTCQAIPIADSAAPIKDADGIILGVVMVFRDVSKEKGAAGPHSFTSAITMNSPVFIIADTLKKS
jgi:hypothetical protein